MRSGERGYMAVVAVLLTTMLLTATAASLPYWSSLIRRDREQEAISRGLQYAEAIRVFQRRFGRLPNRLEELLEVKPRSIRRLWKDPLTKDGAWAVVVQGQGGGSLVVDPRTGRPIGGGAGGQLTEEQTPNAGSPASGSPQPILGPIRGVKSRAQGEAFASFFGAEHYQDWEFTVEALVRATSQPAPTAIPRRNALTIGRPFRFPPPGELPGDGGQDAQPGFPGSPRPSKPGQPAGGEPAPPGGKG
jgi:type II secretory pathway pseudopilin PulG